MNHAIVGQRRKGRVAQNPQAGAPLMHPEPYYGR